MHVRRGGRAGRQSGDGTAGHEHTFWASGRAARVAPSATAGALRGTRHQPPATIAPPRCKAHKLTGRAHQNCIDAANAPMQMRASATRAVQRRGTRGSLAAARPRVCTARPLARRSREAPRASLVLPSRPAASPKNSGCIVSCVRSGACGETAKPHGAWRPTRHAWCGFRRGRWCCRVHHRHKLERLFVEQFGRQVHTALHRRSGLIRAALYRIRGPIRCRRSGTVRRWVSAGYSAAEWWRTGSLPEAKCPRGRMSSSDSGSESPSSPSVPLTSMNRATCRRAHQFVRREAPRLSPHGLCRDDGMRRVRAC